MALTTKKTEKPIHKWKWKHVQWHSLHFYSWASFPFSEQVLPLLNEGSYIQATAKYTSTELGLGPGTHLSSWGVEGAAAATPKLSCVATRRQRGLIITQKRTLALLRKEMDSKWQNQQLPVHPANTQKETQRTEGRRGCCAFCTMCTAVDTGTGQLVCQTAEDMHTPPRFKTEPHQIIVFNFCQWLVHMCMWLH